MGDAQNGLDHWRTMVTSAFRKRPNAAFYIMAGDLVDRGNDIDDWDSMLHNARGVYNQRTLIPAIGNHEIQGGQPTTYLQLFDLPKNGPEKVDPERCYTFKYSNAEFFILDSTLPANQQHEWLEKVLKASKATWKFAVYHHPAYSSYSKFFLMIRLAPSSTALYSSAASDCIRYSLKQLFYLLGYQKI